MKTLMRFVAFVLMLGLVGAGWVWSGAFDVAANRPDGLLDRVAETVAERSIHRRSEGIAAPPSLDDPARLRTGIVHYEEMCVTCHGAPGVKASEIGTGLSPAPPDLGHAGEDEPGELFWIVRNGIRMTGMPAFGVTHSDDEIWAIVAVIKRLPTTSPEQYQAMLRDAGLLASPAAESAAGEPDPDHHHAAGDPPHAHGAGEPTPPAAAEAPPAGPGAAR